jgi:hypothetical protein
MRWAGHVACIAEMRSAYTISVENPEGERPLARPKCRWKDNIKMNLGEMECKGVCWINLVQEDIVADFCERGDEPSGSITSAEFLGQLSDCQPHGGGNRDVSGLD